MTKLCRGITEVICKQLRFSLKDGFFLVTDGEYIFADQRKRNDV